MSTALETAKGTGLTKTGAAVKHLASRLERARQSRNERVARADAEYVEAVRRALADVPMLEHTPAEDVSIEATA